MWRSVVTRLVLSPWLQIFVERFQESHERRDINVTDLDPRELVISVANSTGPCKLAQALQLGERAFQGREASSMHVRPGESQITKRGSLERCDHSLEKAVIVLGRAAKRRGFQINEVPIAEIDTARFLPGGSLPEPG